MDTLMSAVEAIAAIAAGLAARAGLLVVVLAVLAVPVMLLVTGIRGVDAARRRLLGVMRIGGLSWSNQAFYAPSHTWIRPTGRSRVEVGLDDLVQRLFATNTGLTLPLPGTRVLANQSMGEIRTTGRHAALVSPVSGVVTSINHAVVDDPSLVHRDPYARGWLLRIAPSDDAYTRFPQGDAARTWLQDERQRLSRFFEVHLGTAAADGGEFVAPPPTLLSDQQWATLTREFLANP